MKLTQYKSTFWIAVAILASVSSTIQASWFSNDVASEPLQRAHESFLRRDLRAMTTSLKDLFQDPKSDDVSQKNGLALLEKAYALRAGNAIPVDWKLPAEITKMKVGLRYQRRPNADDYSLKISGNDQAVGTIKQLKLTRYPDLVVLDKHAKLGEWEEKVEPGDGPSFELDGPRTVKPAEEGLYLLHIELASGAVTEGWFILSDMLSSDTPKVRIPGNGETFTTHNPSFRFDDFKSPEYKSHESRSLWMAVAKSEAPKYDWIEVWSMWEGSPSRTQVTIGHEPDALGVVRLENGRYNYVLSYKEERRFGDLRLGRQSTTFVPFFVKAN